MQKIERETSLKIEEQMMEKVGMEMRILENGIMERVETRMREEIGVQLEQMVEKMVGEQMEQCSEKLEKTMEEEFKSIQDQVESISTRVGTVTDFRKSFEEMQAEHQARMAEYRNPPFLNDLWESVGTLASRLTDQQELLDDIVGTKTTSNKLRTEKLTKKTRKNSGIIGKHCSVTVASSSFRVRVR